LEQVLTDENGIDCLQKENRNQAPLKFVHAEFQSTVNLQKPTVDLLSFLFVDLDAQ